MQEVLKKKVSKRRVGRSPLTDLDGITAHLAAKLEEKLRRFLKTMTGAIVIDYQVRKLSGVLEDIPVPAMLGIVTVEGLETSALINMSSDLVYHVVDLRMGGDASEAPAPTARTFTAIDSALSEAFFEVVIDCLQLAITHGMGVPLPDIMALTQVEQNITQVRLAPDNADVLIISVALDIGEAARQGSFDLILPLSVLDGFRAAGKRVTPAETDQMSRGFWRTHMTEAAAQARVDVTAILHRMPMKLRDVSALAVGDVLHLPADSLNTVSLRIGREDDRIRLAGARVGQFNDQIMLKLQEDPEPRVLDHLTRALGGDGPRNDLKAAKFPDESS